MQERRLTTRQRNSLSLIFCLWFLKTPPNQFSSNWVKESDLFRGLRKSASKQLDSKSEVPNVTVSVDSSKPFMPGDVVELRISCEKNAGCLILSAQLIECDLFILISF